MSQLSLVQPTRPTPDEGPDTAYTPHDIVEAVLRHLGAELRMRPVWEMHVGGGAFVSVLDAARMGRGPQGIAQPLLVLSTDADPAAPGLTIGDMSAHHDATAGLPEGWPSPDVIVGNPPWSTAREHLEVALRTAGQLVAWVLPGGLPHRGGWRDVWAHAWPDEYIALGRVSYDGPGRTGRGSSMTDSALYVWRRSVLTGSWMGRGLMGWLDRSRGRIVVPGRPT